MNEPWVSEKAIVSKDAIIGAGAKIWHNAQVRELANIGENVIISKDAYIGTGVSVGKNSKVQNSALVYEPAVIDDGVFIGPGVILTNDHFPRAINPDLTLKTGSDWELVGVHVCTGAAIGAGSICVAPVTIGKWATIGAGSVVTKNVPDYALVVGNPARQIGWVGKFGVKLETSDSKTFICPVSGTEYQLIDDHLVEN